MDLASSPTRPLAARLTPVMRVDARLPDVKAKPTETEGPAAAAAEAHSENLLAKTSEQLEPGRLLVQIDVEAGRFVNTLIDANTEEVVRKYPSDAQLAYSRAVKAYLRAISGG